MAAAAARRRRVEGGVQLGAGGQQLVRILRQRRLQDGSEVTALLLGAGVRVVVARHQHVGAAVGCCCLGRLVLVTWLQGGGFGASEAHCAHGRTRSVKEPCRKMEAEWM